MWFLRYASGEMNRQTHTNTLIAIICTPTSGEAKTFVETELLELSVPSRYLCWREHAQRVSFTVQQIILETMKGMANKNTNIL